MRTFAETEDTHLHSSYLRIIFKIKKQRLKINRGAFCKWKIRPTFFFFLSLIWLSRTIVKCRNKRKPFFFYIKIRQHNFQCIKKQNEKEKQNVVVMRRRCWNFRVRDIPDSECVRKSWEKKSRCSMRQLCQRNWSTGQQANFCVFF